MSVFTSKLNPVSGKMEWILMDDAFDYSQQIARSAYADMLHDEDRNVKYHEALKLAIKKVHNANKKAIVLDIGTGTGILSMMAASSGADEVFACEFFNPMSSCAEKIIRLNGYENKITVIHKGSTQLTIGKYGDIPYRANILVTEVFDTELIGEGAVKTFIHAQQQLLEPDAIIIPSQGRIYAAVFESDLINNFNKLNDAFIDDNGNSLKIPPLIRNCSGSASVHDIQLSELPENSFKLISFPQIVLDFDWSGKISIKKKETKFHRLTANSSSIAHGVFMWWDLIMDCEGKIILSCAPKWAQNNGKYAWRDHWMQAVYYFPKNIQLKANQEFTLVANHDEFSLWFDIHNDNNLKSNYEVPVCECGLHLTSRMRVGMVNDKSRQLKFMQAFQSLSSKDIICLNLSECSLLGHYLALASTKKVYGFEKNRIFENVFRNIAKHNNIEHKMQWERSVDKIVELLKQNNEKVSLVVAEPFFSSSILPWHNLQFWYMKNQLSDIFDENVQIIPGLVEFYVMAVQFEHLWKIRAPVIQVEGFNLHPFDDIIQKAITITDDIIDAQPLWEYPCIALSKPHKFLKLNFYDKLNKEFIICSDMVPFEKSGICNGLVLWVDWILNEKQNIKITTGPSKNVIVGKKVTWDMFTKQGVYFFKSDTNVTINNRFAYSIKFHISEGTFEYDFKTL